MAAVRQSLPSAFCDNENQAKVNEHLKAVQEQVAQHFNWGLDRIEKILPCTPYQRDVIDHAIKNDQRTVGYTVYEVLNNMDIEKLAAAWKEVIRCVPALRSLVFTSESGEHFLVVLSESFTWIRLDNPDVN
ncbi:hypothetical protein COCCADRAFT_113233, partial [Bipolaris zeicola 26-R-13]